MSVPLIIAAPASADNAAQMQTSSSITFDDVRTDNQFYKQISWLASEDISTGWPDGTFRPLLPVKRDAMAAFMYRLAGKPAYTPPAVSPFTDVRTDNQFYKEISWLASKQISTGWADGTFRPLLAVNRDAMSAFMYRLAGKPTYASPATSAFTDVRSNHQFYREISWLASKEISTGWPDGTFRPDLAVNRDAMAAFMYRYAGSPEVPPPAPAPLSAVTDVSATGASATSVALSWTNPSTSLYQGVAIRRTNGTTPPAAVSSGTVVTDVATPGSTVTNTGLKASTTYSYSLFAYDNQGNYAPAASVTVTTPVDPSAGPTLSEQRAALRTKIENAKQDYVDSRPYISLLTRADGLEVKDAIAAGTVSLDRTATLVTNASTQTAMTAAAAAVDVEVQRAATVVASAANLKTALDLRETQRQTALTALADFSAGRLSRTTYDATKARASAFSTILAADTRTQLGLLGKSTPAVALKAMGWKDELQQGTGTIPVSSGWVGFAGGCALPVADQKFRPQLPATGPGVATNTALVAATKERGETNATLKPIHEQMLRSATAQVSQTLSLDQLRAGYVPRIARLGYGWLEAGNTDARDVLQAETRQILQAGPEYANTLTTSHLLLAAGTASNWSGVTGMEETVLVRWLGPHTCLHADRENFVDAPTNIAAIHNSASFVASAVFLKNSPEQAAALAKESLTSIQPALDMILTDGGTKEGPGYWTYQSRAIATLYSTLPNAYATMPITMPSMAKVSDYALNSTGPDGLPTPFADALPNPLSPLMPAWDAYSRNDPAVGAWVERELIAKPDAYLMWWYTNPSAIPAKKSSLYPYTGFAALHASGTTATLKGGDNAANHAHLDLGNVSLLRHGIQWSVDPGQELGSPPGYYSDPTRWTFWKAGTSAHSTLSLSGGNQPVTAKAATTLPSSSTASVNLVQALPGATSATRTMNHGATSTTLKDTVRASSGLPLQWQWVTDAQVVVEPTLNRATLKKDGKQVIIALTGVPAGSTLSAVTAPGTGPDGAKLTILKLVTPKVTALDLVATIK